MSLLRLTKGVLFIFFVINLPFFTIFTGRFISGSCLGLRSDETDLFKVVLAHTDTIKVSIFFGMHAVLRLILPHPKDSYVKRLLY